MQRVEILKPRLDFTESRARVARSLVERGSHLEALLTRCDFTGTLRAPPTAR